MFEPDLVVGDVGDVVVADVQTQHVVVGREHFEEFAYGFVAAAELVPGEVDDFESVEFVDAADEVQEVVADETVVVQVKLRQFVVIVDKFG